MKIFVFVPNEQKNYIFDFVWLSVHCLHFINLNINNILPKVDELRNAIVIEQTEWNLTLTRQKITIISPNFLVWKFYGKAQFPHQEIRWNFGILRSVKLSVVKLKWKDMNNSIEKAWLILIKISSHIIINLHFTWTL